MELKRIFHAYVRKLWLIVTLALFGGGVAAYISFFTITPEYKADTTLYIVNRDKTQLMGQALSYSDVVNGRQMIQDYSGIIYSRSVITSALRDLKDYNLNENTISTITSVQLQDESSILVISATWTEPYTAAAVANAMSHAFTEKIGEITNSDNIGILDEALVPYYPEPVGHVKNILIGILAGFAIAFAAVYLIELFDNTIRSAEDVEIGLHLNVIGIIPNHEIR